MQCFSGSPSLVEIIGLSGFDFVMIDTEHSSVGPETVEHLVRCAENVDLTPLVRVEENAPAPIRKALETGAAGVIVPRVGSAAELKAAIAAAQYPPAGLRGMCPSTRAADYSVEGWRAFVERTNDEVLVIPLIETPEALENVSEICELSEIVLFGPGDLGMALGVGASGMQTPEVRAAFDRVRQAASETGTALMGVPFPDWSAKSCAELIASGVTVLLHGIDQLLFAEVCHSIVSELSDVLESSVGSAVSSPEHAGSAR